MFQSLSKKLLGLDHWYQWAQFSVAFLLDFFPKGTTTILIIELIFIYSDNVLLRYKVRYERPIYYYFFRIGRKRGLLFSAVPFLLGWILVATTSHLYQLYAARLIFGFALAIPFTILPMYIGEIAEV